ncbi:MAG: helix-turn-helix transcriptional regulator [Smithella sp.]
MPNDTWKLGERLKQVREQLNQNQDSFASSLSVSINTVSNWERGLGQPPAGKLALIRDKYGTDLNWLISGEENSPSGECSKVSASRKALDSEKLRQVMMCVEDGLARHNKAIELDKKVSLITLLYEYIIGTDKDIDTELVDKYLNLIT